MNPSIRLYVDVKLVTHEGLKEVSFGPFSERRMAEQSLLEVMRRTDVRGAIIRNPDA